MKKGFTLVELSIVLVIIGLLVGGILVGQSLIDSAKVTAMVKQIQQVDIAQGIFYQRYRQLAGDSTKFTPPGDGNARIAPVGAPNGETDKFFAHLVQGVGFKLEKMSVTGGGGVIVAKKSDGADSQGKVVYLTLANVEEALDIPLAQGLTPPGWVIDSNMLGLSNHYIYNVQDSVNGYADPYSPQTSYAFDNKMDDGLPNSGNLRGDDASGNRYPCGIRTDGSRSSISTLKNDPNLKYDLGGAYKDDPCTIYIKVGFTQR